MTLNRYDYSSSCNLLSKRYLLAPTEELSRLSTSPAGVPLVILNSLPLGYDLRLAIANLFLGVQRLTTLTYTHASSSSPGSKSVSPDGSASSPPLDPLPASLEPKVSSWKGDQVSESAGFVSNIDSSLYKSYSAPDTTGNRSRRRYILQCYHILALIYTTFIIRSTPLADSSNEPFTRRLSKILSVEDPAWGSSVISVFRFLNSESFLRPWYRDEHGGVKDNSWYEAEVKHVIDASDALGWEIWYSLNNALLYFFITDEGCKGRLQTLWKSRVAMVVGQPVNS